MSTAQQPAPRRHRSGTNFLLIGLCASPTGWILQLVAAYGLSSFVCAPAGRPRPDLPAAWTWEKPVLLALNLICLAFAIAAGIAAYRSWREMEGEKSGEEQTLLEIGEGRTRFLAACGVMSAAGFGLAILFNTVEFFTVPACWGGAL